MSEIAIKVENLSKQYKIGALQPRYLTIRDQLMLGISHMLRRSKSEPIRKIWGLKDISLEIREGAVVGLIGRNGAGKSTLLKLLSRITRPTKGRIELRGRVASLLEVGTGFHPELTGRENIYLNGAILGMLKREIDRKFDEIVEFSGIEQFLDTAVKHYSSGMYVRLAFAVAAHLEPEILLVDEVLAVGDSAFQKKCLGKMGDISRSGRTVIFVSHNMAMIQNLCSTCVLLEKGQLQAYAQTDQVVASYISSIDTSPKQDLANREDRTGDGSLRFTALTFLNDTQQEAASFLSGADFYIKLEYEMMQPIPSSATIRVSVSIKDMYGDSLLLCANDLTGEIEHNWNPIGTVACRIHEMPLTAGLYNINVFVSVNGVIADWVIDAATFDIENSDFYGTGRYPLATHSHFNVRQQWSLIAESK